MAPVTEVFPQTGTVIEGGNITLICNVSGVPSPSVVWTEVISFYLFITFQYAYYSNYRIDLPVLAFQLFL